MSDIRIRVEGSAGRITLARPQALNALTHAMTIAIEAALDAWRDDPRVGLVLIDAEGSRAFCAGGDLVEIYEAGRRGDFGYPRRFWAREYRMNAAIARYPKPFVALMQGFVMGGGVGVAAHGSHRVVGESARVAMPECGIGLIPDVGATHLLAAAPGRLGEYLGMTGYRMEPGDALRAGFADHFVPEADWPALITRLEDGDAGAIGAFARPAPAAALDAHREAIDDAFSGPDLRVILARLEASDWGHATRATLARRSPLALACTLRLVRDARAAPGVEAALSREFRFTARSLSDGDLLEGIRAAVVDKDRAPLWRDDLDGVTPEQVERMLAPLGPDELDWELAEDGMEIGFIGLGNMGAPMARNLAAAGHAVFGYDAAGVTVAGTTPAGSAAEAAAGREAVVTMLPDGAILRAVYAEIVPAARPGAALVDCSTVDVESARAAAAAAAAAGLEALDAPVSGGTKGAAAGTLTFMVGGSAAAFAAAAPLFDVMGSRAVHCGAAGAGQAAKICNNMILGVSMIAVCEAFALADRLGLAREAMFEVVSTSSGACWSASAYCPAPGVGPVTPADDGYRPGFATELMLKDLRLSQRAAASVGAATPMGERAAALYADFLEDGGRGVDFSGILPWLEKKSRDA